MLLFFLCAGQVGGVPSDVADQIASMQKAIDGLSAEVSSVSVHVVALGWFPLGLGLIVEAELSC